MKYRRGMCFVIAWENNHYAFPVLGPNRKINWAKYWGRYI